MAEFFKCQRFLRGFLFGVLLFSLAAGSLVVRAQEAKIKLPTKGLCAHRGAMATHPENTLVAFREAIMQGAHMIEFDVQLTKDSALVLMHDATVDRTTNGTGRVADLTLSDIKSLDAGSWKSPEFAGEKVPLLEEALEIMPVNCWLNIHIKGGGDIAVRIARVLERTSRLHQAFLACGRTSAKKARNVVPEVLICNMDRQSNNWDYVNATIDMDADFIQLLGNIIPEFENYSRELSSKGIRVNYFGTDSPEKLKQLFDYGVGFPLVNDIVRSAEYAEDMGIPRNNPVFRVQEE